MKHLWNLDLDTALEWYKLLNDIEKDLKKELTKEQTEIVFLEYMKLKNIKSSGATELTQEELIKEYISHGKKVLKIDGEGHTIFKPKENNYEID